MKDPFIWVLIAGVIAAGVLIGRMRRDPPLVIALDVGGYAIFLGGLYWASQISRDAFVAAGAASLGALVFTTASNLRRRASPPA